MSFSILALALALPVPQGTDATSYRYDDGSPDTAFGASGAVPLDFCWFHRFDAVDGADLITRVDLAFGWNVVQCGVANGTPVTLCVWDDPNDDGDPSDAVLLTQAAAVVENTDMSVFNKYQIPPTAVTGVFFVGCYVTLAVGECAAPADRDNFGVGLSWVACNLNPGAFDPTCLPCNGSNCGPFDMTELGFGVVWLLRARGEGCGAPTVYCTPKVNSCGLLPRIASTGVPSATSTSGFVVSATNTRALRSGLLIYSGTGSAAIPFQGGFLCLAAPVLRSVPVTDVSGTPAQCDGSLVIDMNCFASGACGGNPAPFLMTPGARVNCQWWARDTLAAGSLLSDGLEYVVCQ